MTASKKLEKARERYNKLNSKNNKTPEDKKNLEAAKKELQHLERKSHEKSENHSNTGKGYR